MIRSFLNPFAHVWFAVLILFSVTVRSQTTRPHDLRATTPPKFEIVDNTAHAGTRSVYVYLEEATYDQQSVEEVIRRLEAQYCDPFLLDITIFSDRDMIPRYLDGLAATSIVHFKTTPEGRSAAAKYSKKVFPPQTGYLRAHYRRNERFEYFSISPNKDSVEMRTIVINDTGTGIKTDSYAIIPKSSCRASK
jgi:hypothetical protein